MPSQTQPNHLQIQRKLEACFVEGKQFELSGNLAAAEKIYREIVTAFERYGFNAATPCAALGYALLHQKKLKEAEHILLQSARLNPSLLESHANLAAVYRLQERWKDCETSSKKALEIEPKHVPSLLNLAEAQRETCRYGLSVQNFLLALSLDGENVEARKGLALNYVSLGEPSVSIPMFRKVLELEPAAWRLQSNMIFAMQYDPTLSNEEVLAAHQTYGQKARTEMGPARTSFPNSKDPQRKIRLGYISSDFHYHVVMRFAEPVFRCHDRSQFELVFVHTGKKMDQDTERLKSLADQWIEIGSLDLDKAAEKVWALELDILVDLAGHSGTSKLPLLARRLAPIQVLWLGYSGTSGIDTMDYIVVDHQLAPPGERTYFTEKPIRLPCSYLSFKSSTSVEIGPLPYEKNGYITFGCMNNPSKVNQYTVAWWSQILQAVPQSKLLMRYVWFNDPLVRERIAKMFRAHGIGEDRVLMGVGHREFLHSYNEVDIALDTFPYNGTTTTCEALWMGIPVVVLRGDRFVSRVGASLLTYMGLSDLITETPERYIQLAVELAQNPAHLADLRRQLRPHLEKTPVFDAPAFTQGLETAYREIFARWCQESMADMVSLAESVKNLSAPKNSQNYSLISVL